ncbi:MAG: hypothetical protein FD172_2955 [Methylocystaceae bacterium]|nr:MAG: hypothetical protein FD172_2955 [Methylocystaceae bacterium]
MVRLLRLFGLFSLFRRFILSWRRSPRADDVGVRRFCAWFFDAPDRRLCVRAHRGRARPARRADALGAADVSGLASHRSGADLCEHRRRRAGDAAPGAPYSGRQSWRRIWIERDLSRRDGASRAARVLFELSICDDDRRPIAGAVRAAHLAECRARRSGAARLGLAHPFRLRRAAGDRGALYAPRPCRDVRLQGVARRAAARIAQRAARA